MNTILTNYYQRNHSKQFLQTIYYQGDQIIHTNYYQKNHFKQYLQTVIRQIIPNNFYILLPGKSNVTYKLLSEKTFQTTLTNYFLRNNSKQFLQTTTREIECYI